jgi:hypothetical protein
MPPITPPRPSVESSRNFERGKRSAPSACGIAGPPSGAGIAAPLALSGGTSGPPVRALDRYSFSIRNGHLFLGKPFSVSHVDGAGATAVIHKWTFSFPGEHVNGLESWLYPIQPPH